MASGYYYQQLRLISLLELQYSLLRARCHLRGTTDILNQDIDTLLGATLALVVEQIEAAYYAAGFENIRCLYDIDFVYTYRKLLYSIYKSDIEEDDPYYEPTYNMLHAANKVPSKRMKMHYEKVLKEFLNPPAEGSAEEAAPSTKTPEGAEAPEETETTQEEPTPAEAEMTEEERKQKKARRKIRRTSPPVREKAVLSYLRSYTSNPQETEY